MLMLYFVTLFNSCIICRKCCLGAERAMAPHSSTLAWQIPWMEDPGGLSMGSLGVGHDWVTSLSLSTFMHWRSKWQPTRVFLPGESQGWGAWWAAVYGVAQSWTRLKRLRNSSSSSCLGDSLGFSTVLSSANGGCCISIFLIRGLLWWLRQ